MEKLSLLDAVALPIARANVDTDQIVPARYLQKPRSADFGSFLFRDLRFRDDGREVPGFVLNQAPYRSARIVVAQRNFGCGSSREHAVWALYDYGIRAVIAPSFGDIFAANAAKNGLLTIALEDQAVSTLIALLQRTPGLHLRVDLPAQRVALPGGTDFPFEIGAYLKNCLLEGLDELDYTLSQMASIEAFERSYRY
ncbi:3-isopropylmalate dehydratase small subunit [Paraburkholderia jirisanensis]